MNATDRIWMFAHRVALLGAVLGLLLAAVLPAAAQDDATPSAEEDGVGDGDEVAAGTDPRDPASS